MFSRTSVTRVDCNSFFQEHTSQRHSTNEHIDEHNVEYGAE